MRVEDILAESNFKNISYKEVTGESNENYNVLNEVSIIFEDDDDDDVDDDDNDDDDDGDGDGDNDDDSDYDGTDYEEQQRETINKG